MRDRGTGSASGGASTRLRAVLYDQGAGSWPWPDDLHDDPSGARRQAEPDERCGGWRGCGADASGSGNADRGAMTEGSATVFIVDDDAGVLKALTRLVGANGYQTQLSFRRRSFSRTMTAHFQAVRFSMSACRTSTVSRCRKRWARQALSGRSSSSPERATFRPRVRAMKAGAVDFLTKPVSDEDLLSAIARAVEQDGEARRNRTELESIEAKIGYVDPARTPSSWSCGRRPAQQADRGRSGHGGKDHQGHRGRMMEKMGVRTVADLVRMAEKAGVPLPQR